MSFKNNTRQKDFIRIDGIDYNITDIVYSDECYIDGNIFGTAIAKTLEFKMDLIPIDLAQKEFTYFTSTNDLVINMGNFITVDVNDKETQGEIKVLAYDYMLKFTEPFTTFLDFKSGTVKIIDLLNEICERFNIELATPTFANMNFIVDSNQFESTATFRDVIKAIAQISGRIAKIKKDNKLYLISFKNQQVKDRITTSDYFELDTKKQKQSVNTVVLGLTGVDGENITKSSVTNENEKVTISINDNPFAYTQANRIKLIEELYNELHGFNYKSYAIKYQGLPTLEVGDKIELVDKSHNIEPTYILRYTYKSPKGLESEMSAPLIIKSLVKYEVAPSIAQKLKHTELRVDKELGKISAVIIENEKNAENFTKLEQQVNGLTLDVQTAGQNNLIHDSVFYSFAKGKDFKTYYSMAFEDDKGNKMLGHDFNDITNYLNSRGATSFLGGSTNARLTQALNDYNVNRVKLKENVWYARQNTTSTTKMEAINVPNSESKHGLKAKNNQVIQSFNIDDSNSSYSFTFKIRKEIETGRAIVRIRRFSNNPIAVDFGNEKLNIVTLENGITTTSRAPFSSFSGNSGSSNMSSFWTKVVKSKTVKTQLLPAGTYTLKGNCWVRSTSANKRLEFAYYLQSDPERRKSFAWKINTGLFAQTITINEPFYFDSIAFLDILKTEPFSYSIENLRLEVGNTVNDPASKSFVYKEIPSNTTILDFQTFNFENIKFDTGYYVLDFLTDNNGEADITDIMLSKSDKVSKWTPAVGENRNSTVNIGIEGISVFSENTSNLTELTSYGLTGYYVVNDTKEPTFKLNGDKTQVYELEVKNGLYMPPFKIVNIENGENAGWHFVVLNKKF